MLVPIFGIRYLKVAMRAGLLVFLVLLYTQGITFGEDWTINGKTLRNVVVGKVEADRVHVLFDGGCGTVPLTDLPPDLQRRFGFEPTASRAAQAKREALANEYRDQEAAEAQANISAPPVVHTVVTTVSTAITTAAASSSPQSAPPLMARLPDPKRQAQIDAQIAYLQNDIREKNRLIEEEKGNYRYSRGGYRDAIAADFREIATLRASQ